MEGQAACLDQAGWTAWFWGRYADGMTDWYRIGQLAKAAKVPVSTLRYYEREDLLTPDGRTDGNYRVYAPDALERVRFIRTAQSVGFSLDDIKALLHVRDGVRVPCAEVERLIAHRLGDVRRRLSELREMDRNLKRYLAVCRESANRDHCGVVDDLSSR